VETVDGVREARRIPLSREASKDSHLQERPDPDWVRGTCAVCGEPVVSNCYYATLPDGSRGYVLVWECWASLAEPPRCDYRKVL
jgi:hypothetical protein